MAVGGFMWDAPDTPKNVRGFGRSGSGDRASAFPQVRVVTWSECDSHAVVGARLGARGGKGSGEQSLAKALYRQLDEDMLLIADRSFYNFADWCTAADTEAALLWRVTSDLALTALQSYPDGSSLSALVDPQIKAAVGGRRGRGSSCTRVRCVFWVGWRGRRVMRVGRAVENHGPCPGLTGRRPSGFRCRDSTARSRRRTLETWQRCR
ncbi:hypothetical protein ACFWP5_28400 [Streptomyces sp. NPDC058469]|uniref:hypothetical protein n=1 Tax=Streptomyces sp. NPDC058469 TaxID=3346514 RepID=UPI003651A8AB